MGLSISDLAALAQRMVVLDALGNALAPATTAELRFLEGDDRGISRQRVVALHFESEVRARAFIEAAQAAQSATKKS